MPICPECRTEQQQRKAGACPNCGTQVEAHKGYWYRTDLGSPTVALVSKFEKLVSKQIETKFSIPRKSPQYRRELVAAQRYLDRAEGNFEVAAEALEILFTDKRFSWKTRTTLMYIGTDFNVALAIAQHNEKLRIEKNKRARQFLTALDIREDVFQI